MPVGVNAGPNWLKIATLAASCPYATVTRPPRGASWVASKVYQRPPNLSLAVDQAGTYTFLMDVKEPYKPLISVFRKP
jgi:hypothetical protein